MKKKYKIILFLLVFLLMIFLGALFSYEQIKNDYPKNVDILQIPQVKKEILSKTLINTVIPCILTIIVVFLFNKKKDNKVS